MSHCMSYSLAAGRVAMAHAFFRVYDPAKHCTRERRIPRQVQWNWEPGIWTPNFSLEGVSSYLKLDTYTWSGLYYGVLCWTRLFWPKILSRWYEELQLLFSRALCFVCYQVDAWKIGQLAQWYTASPEGLASCISCLEMHKLWISCEGYAEQIQLGTCGYISTSK